MHKRSLDKLLKRRIRAIIFSNAFYDGNRSETVSTMSRLEILGLLHEPISVSDVPDVEKGEVLFDSRGNGSFQRRPPYHEQT